MSAIGDITGDGYPEVIVGAPFADQERGELAILKGPSLNPVSHYRGKTPYTRFGYRLKGAGDVNLDGLRDVLVGEPCSDLVWVFTPSTQEVIRRHQGPVGAGKAGYGHAMSRAGDVNGDGRPDYLLGHPGEWEDQLRRQEGDDGFGTSVSFNPQAAPGQVQVLIGSPAGGDLPGHHAPGMISGRILP